MVNRNLFSKFTILAQTFSDTTDYSYANKKCKNEDVLTFFNILGDILFLMKKVDMYSKKRTYGTPT